MGCAQWRSVLIAGALNLNHRSVGTIYSGPFVLSALGAHAKLTETKRAVKLGALLVGLEFITQQELVAIMDMASQVGMPLGRALVLSGKITDAELTIALQLHVLMRTSDVRCV